MEKIYGKFTDNYLQSNIVSCAQIIEIMRLGTPQRKLRNVRGILTFKGMLHSVIKFLLET